MVVRLDCETFSQAPVHHCAELFTLTAPTRTMLHTARQTVDSMPSQLIWELKALALLIVIACTSFIKHDRARFGAATVLLGLLVFCTLQSVRISVHSQETRGSTKPAQDVMLHAVWAAMNGVWQCVELVCALNIGSTMPLSWKLLGRARARFRRHRPRMRRRVSRCVASLQEWSAKSIAVIAHAVQLCAALALLDGFPDKAVAFAGPLAALALVAALCKRARSRVTAPPICEDDVRAAIIRQLTAESRSKTEMELRISVIHRIEVCQRKQAWLKYYETGDLVHLEHNAFRNKKNAHKLLSDHADASTEQLIVEVAMLEAHELLRPKTESFAALLDRVKQEELQSISWRLQKLGGRLRSFSAAFVAVTAACARRLRGLAHTMRWQALGFLLVSWLAVMVEIDEPQLLNLLNTATTAALHTIMFALLICELATSQAAHQSLPVAYWIHILCLEFGDALLALTVPALLSAFCAFANKHGWNHAVMIVVPALPLLFVGIPDLLQHRHVVICTAVLFQSRTLRRLAAKAVNTVFSSPAKTAKLLVQLRSSEHITVSVVPCSSLRTFDDDGDGAFGLSIINALLWNLPGWHPSSVLGVATNKFTSLLQFCQSATAIDMDSCGPGVPVLVAVGLLLVARVENRIDMLYNKAKPIIATSKTIWDEFTGFEFDSTKGFPGEGPKHSERKVDVFGFEEEQIQNKHDSADQGRLARQAPLKSRRNIVDADGDVYLADADGDVDMGLSLSGVIAMDACVAGSNEIDMRPRAEQKQDFARQTTAVREPVEAKRGQGELKENSTAARTSKKRRAADADLDAHEDEQPPSLRQRVFEPVRRTVAKCRQKPADDDAAEDRFEDLRQQSDSSDTSSDESEEDIDDTIVYDEDEVEYIGKERLTKQQWNVVSIHRRYKTRTQNEYLYEVEWENGQKTLEPWASLSEATKLWYKNEKGRGKDQKTRDKFVRIYEEEEEKLKKIAAKAVPKAKRTGRKLSRKRGGISSSKANKAKIRAKRKQPPRSPAPPPTETSAGSAKLQRQLRSLDEDFERESRIAEQHFLQPPTFAETARAVEKYRELTSTPYCAQEHCAVCDQLTWKREVTTYALDERASECKEEPVERIDEDLLSSMTKLLTAHNVEEGQRIKRTKQEMLELNPGEWRDKRPFGELKDCLLSSKGISTTRGARVNICKSCSWALQNGKLPQSAIANNLVHGERPKELQDLTWLEEQLIAVHRVVMHVVNLQGNDQVDGSTAELKSNDGEQKSDNRKRKVCKIKGNSVVLTHHAPKILTALPPAAKDVNEFVKVVFTKADGELPDKFNMRKLFGVRRSKVRKALQWLKEHNPIWANVDISDENLSTYSNGPIDETEWKNSSEDCIPEPFWDSILTSKHVEAAAENVGAASGEHDADENDEGIHCRGIVDTNARAQSVDQLVKSAQRRLQGANTAEAEQKFLNVPEGGMQSTYKNPRLWLGAFPTLFPHGVGGPQCEREKKMSLESFAKHAMLTSDGRFRKHGVFMFFLFNVIQIHRANKYAGMSMRWRRFLDFSKHRELLTAENLEEAFKQLSAVNSRGGRPKLSNIRNAGLRTALEELFKEFGTLSRVMPLTDAAKTTARHELHALQSRFGIMDLFLTINPNDKHAPLMCKLAGENIAIGLDDPDEPDRSPDPDPKKHKTWTSGLHRSKLLAENPLAAVQYSHMVMQAFLKALVGFDRDDKNHRVGVLGRTTFYHFNPEEQGRGSLHYHGGIGIASHLSRQQIMRKLKEPEFQKQVIAYLNQLILQQPPALCTSGPFAQHEYQSLELKREEVKCDTKLHDLSTCGKTHFDGSKCMAAEKSERLKDDHVAFGRIPAPGNDEKAFWQRTGAYLDKLIPAEQTHIHKHTRACVSWKDKRKRALNKKGKMKPDYCYHEWLEPDFQCRFKFAREIVPATHITPDGKIVLERQHHWTNNYHPILAACLRTNHDIQLTWGLDQQGVAMYMTNYATKQQKHLFNKLPMLKIAAEKWEARQKAHKPSPSAEEAHGQRMDTSSDEKITQSMDTSDGDQKASTTPITDAERTNKSFIVKMFNKLQGDTELSAHTVVAHLIGLPERYSSHEFRPLTLMPFLRWAESSDAERKYISADRDARTTSEGETYKLRRSKNTNRLSASNLRMDYYHRPSGLENCNLYDFVAGAEVKRFPKSKDAMQDVDDADNEEEVDIPTQPVGSVHPFISVNGSAHSMQAECGLTFTPDKFVPLVQGRQLPCRHKQPERFAKMILLRFKPFRAIEDLRPTGSTWEEALNEFLNSCSPRIQRLIDNLQAVRDAESARADDFQKQEEELQRCMKAGKLRQPRPQQPDESESESDDDFDDDDDGDESMDDSTTNPLLRFRPLKDAGGLMASAVKNAESMGVYASECKVQRVSAAGLRSGTDNTQADIHFARAQLKKRLEASRDGRLSELLGKDKAHGEAKQKPPQDPRMQALPGSKASEIEREFTLNQQQRFAFRIIINHLQQELENEGRPPRFQKRVEQLKMFITGVGGTGKSHVISAVQTWCKRNLREEWVRTAAFTGSAASNILGRTLHSMLGIPARKPQDVISNSIQKREEIQRALQGVKLLFIDEISLVDCAMASAINYALQAAKGVQDQRNPPDWGGLHVVVLGDFFQLPPCTKGSELYSAASATKQCENFAWVNPGRRLWERINTVVQLDEQMRQCDERYLRMLTHVRTGEVDDADMELIESCMHEEAKTDGSLRVGRATKLPREWQQAPMAVPRNPVRTFLNLQDILAKGRAQGRTVLISVAEDEALMNSTKDLSESTKRYLKRLPDNKTSNLPGLVPLLVGAKYVLRENEQPSGSEFALVNGADCILEQIILDEREPEIPPTAEVHFLKYQPQAVIMRFPDSTMPAPLQGFSDPQLIPIVPLTHYPEAIVNKRTNKTVQFSRTQLPISPARAITAHASQGRTYSKLLVDLNIKENQIDRRAIYVLLSRVKCRHGLRIMCDFNRALLTKKPHAELLAEQGRLQALIGSTTQKYESLMPSADECRVVKPPSTCPDCAKAALAQTANMDTDSEETPAISLNSQSGEPALSLTAAKQSTKKRRTEEVVLMSDADEPASKADKPAPRNNSASSSVASNSTGSSSSSSSQRREGLREKPLRPADQRQIAVLFDHVRGVPQTDLQCGLNAHFHAQVMLKHAVAIGEHLQQSLGAVKPLNLPSLHNESDFKTECKAYCTALGLPHISKAQNLSSADIRTLGGEKPLIVIDSVPRLRGQLDEGSAVELDDLRRLKKAVVERWHTAVCVLNTTPSETAGDHWIAVAIKRTGVAECRVLVVDSLQDTNARRIENKTAARALCDLLYRSHAIDQPERMDQLRACAEAESIARGALMKYSDCQSCWHSLFLAMLQGHHVLFNQDIGQQFVLQVQQRWVKKRLVDMNNLRFGVGALFNALLRHEQEELNNRCVLPPQRRRLERLLDMQIMSSVAELRTMQTEIRKVLHITAKHVNESTVAHHFGHLLDCAKSTRLKLIHHWLSA